MSRSVLLQLARDSIQEVFQAKKTINIPSLLKEHPLLLEKIDIIINIYRENELKSSYAITQQKNSLANNIIIGAKKVAFENGEILTTSEYLHSEIELILHTPEGDIRQKDNAILNYSHFEQIP